MRFLIGYNRHLHRTNTTKRNTFQVDKRDHRIYLRDKQNLDSRLVRKQYEDQPHPIFKDSNIHYQIVDRTRAIGFGGIGAMHKLVCKLKLDKAINEARAKVCGLQEASFRKEAIIDVDGTIAGTTGECKEGMDIAYNGIWGYAPLLVTLANTNEVNEVLYLVNRAGKPLF